MIQFKVLGTPFLATSYEDLVVRLPQWARRPRPLLLEFGNTQIATMLRHEPQFRKVMSDFDYFIPDSTPLIWCLNRAGAGLKDRIYGPTFMREFLSASPPGGRHYLLGGSAECGARIREKFSKLNPNLQIVGSFHGRCRPDGVLDGKAEHEVMEELNRLSPDFIWVGFGAPKQQLWAKKHAHLMKRGIIMMVGQAFDVNADMKPDAPLWMQRLGLTWLFRLCLEPRRLGPRYAKWNFLFLWYLFRDGMRGKALGGPEVIPD